jgi:D-alanyl-lipoteichoic acid acyltransferase DltB (MBOAT superfamily)
LTNIFAFDDASPLLFTQLYFWVFFAVVLMLLIPFQSKLLMRNTFLFFVSVFFYYKTSGIFTLILLFATILSFLTGKALGKAKSVAGRKLWLIIGIIINLLVLCYFKYAYFFTDLINVLLGTNFVVRDYFAMLGNAVVGTNLFSVDVILLPVGISFYTFQCISYLMDIYRRRINPVKNILDYGFYVSFFPQLVAGPIVRANEFVPQLYRPYFLSRRHFGMAVFWILNGLAKKIILSDYIAVNFIDRVFANPTMYDGFQNLVALFGYSLQVYADFSGYTDIATGVALLMGFYLPLNFNSPYKAPNASNFWKRWHISLSKWLQDYLYIPLGGNREATFGTFAVIFTIALVGTILSGSIWVAIIVVSVAIILFTIAVYFPERRKKITTNINSMNTMLLGGLWHGASMNFMIWGGLNGIGMVIYKLWHPLTVYWRFVVVVVFWGLFVWLWDYSAQPVFRIAVVWVGCLMLGTFVAMIGHIFRLKGKLVRAVELSWSVLQTFVFITFTRLFFRSGSNLDPAEANETAWQTAKNMVIQIGSEWNTEQIPNVCSEYKLIFGLIVLGMIIHWLPTNFKRRYRLCFAKMPLIVMLLVSVFVIFVVYQFVTADLQKFIYFQF